jgi:AcrR family transcriptional regulator
MVEELDRQDRRVKRTLNLLAKALIALTLENGYDAISIRDITQRADVGYATFFRHYHDKDELLQDVLDVVLDELMDVLLRSSIEDDPELVGLLLFTYVEQHNEIVRVLLSSRSSSALMQRIIDAGIQSALTKSPPLGNDVVPTEIAAYHLVTASVALIQWWVEHEMPYSPQRMSKIYHELIVRPTRERSDETH